MSKTECAALSNTSSMKKAVIVAFEGPDYSGKTTQIRNLEATLRELSRDVVMLRDPGGSPLAEQIRNIVKYHDDSVERMDPFTEATLFLASRSQMVRSEVLKQIGVVDFILLDRFTDSTMVYQGLTGRSGIDLEFLRGLCHLSAHAIVPDITFYFKLSPEEAHKRYLETRSKDQTSKAVDRFDSFGLDGYTKIYNAYEQHFGNEMTTTDRCIVVIDASKSIQDIANDIKVALFKVLIDQVKDLSVRFKL